MNVGRQACSVHAAASIAHRKCRHARPPDNAKLTTSVGGNWCEIDICDAHPTQCKQMSREGTAECETFDCVGEQRVD